MKFGIIGGLLIGGLLSCVLFGLYGILLIIAGIIGIICINYKEKKKEKEMQFHFYSAYPPYNY